MKLLESVHADNAADAVIATSVDLAREIDKIAVVVGGCGGVVGNCMLYRRQI